jgi:hypothetical protein
MGLSTSTTCARTIATSMLARALALAVHVTAHKALIYQYLAYGTVRSTTEVRPVRAPLLCLRERWLSRGGSHNSTKCPATDCSAVEDSA